LLQTAPDEGAYLPHEDEEVPDLSQIGGYQVREVREGALEWYSQYIDFKLVTSMMKDTKKKRKGVLSPLDYELELHLLLLFRRQTS
jgi:hypothetical protein